MKGLLVSYWFPPKSSIAALRTYAIAKYLAEYGISMDVLAPDWNGALKLPFNFKLYPTHQTEDIVQYGSYSSKIREFIVRGVLYRFFKYNHFRDLKPGLFFHKATEALGSMDLQQYDFVITSFGPLDTIHIGKYIKEKCPDIKWIIDYRDHFSLNQYNGYGIYRSLFKRFEKSLTRTCDAFVTVSKHLCESQEQLLGKKGFVCYNGYDDYEVKTNPAFEESLKKMTGLPIIAHTGSLYSGTRDIRPFFRYFAQQRLDEKFSIVFAIIYDEDEQYVRNIQKEYSIKNVFILRNLPFADSISLQQHSEYLLLFADTDGRGNGYLTGKFFEYMHSHKPVIYSGATHNYELYELLKEHKLGEHFEKFDYTQKALPAGADVSMFHRRYQVTKLARFIEEEVSKKQNAGS